MKLLLVEDNDDLAEVTEALLSRLGCEVRRVVDPQGALRLIADEPAFDVVLSDIKMPGGMDGLGLARVLRDACPNLPVVLISGYAAQTLAGEDFVVLDKPCQPSELVAALHDAIEGTAVHP
jgi:CheY-like chemotaxis protein